MRNPYSVKHWLRYIDHKKKAPKYGVNIIYERALKQLPGSYKLWYNYLRTRRQQIKGNCQTVSRFFTVFSNLLKMLTKLMVILQVVV